MFPNPVDTLGRFITQISTIEVSAEKKIQPNVPAVGSPQLAYLLGLFFATLVRIREVAGRFSLNQHGEFATAAGNRHDRRIDRNIHLLTAILGHRNIHSERERARLHLPKSYRQFTCPNVFIAALLQPGRYTLKLPLFLGITNDWICVGSAQSIRDDRRRSTHLGPCRACTRCDPHKKRSGSISFLMVATIFASSKLRCDTAIRLGMQRSSSMHFTKFGWTCARPISRSRAIGGQVDILRICKISG